MLRKLQLSTWRTASAYGTKYEEVEKQWKNPKELVIKKVRPVKESKMLLDFNTTDIFIWFDYMPVKRARAPAANLSDSTVSLTLKVISRVFCHMSFYKRTPTICWSSFKSKADRNGPQNRVKNCPNSRLNQDLKIYFWSRSRENFLSWLGDSLLVWKEGIFFFYFYLLLLQQMAFNQSPSLSNNPNILNKYFIFTDGFQSKSIIEQQS